LYRGIIDFNKGYQPRTNIVQVEEGDLVRNSHSILARRRQLFSHLFSVHEVSDVRQTEIHTAELVPDPSTFEGEMAIEKLNRHISPGIDQIQAELIKARDRTTHSDIHNLINSIWKKKDLPKKWRESIILPIYRKGNKTNCSYYRGTSLLPTTYKIYSTSCCQV